MDIGRARLVKIVKEAWLPNVMVSGTQTLRFADRLIANDVVPVVRCKNCDWYRKHEGGICVNPKCVKSWYGCPAPAEHFCSYGERRD